jgi:hypothetical protein
MSDRKGRRGALKLLSAAVSSLALPGWARAAEEKVSKKTLVYKTVGKDELKATANCTTRPASCRQGLSPAGMANVWTRRSGSPTCSPTASGAAPPAASSSSPAAPPIFPCDCCSGG